MTATVAGKNISKIQDMQNSFNFRRSTADVIAWLFIFLWIYASANKLLDYQTFRVKLGQSPLLTPIAGFVAWFIPVVEILIAVLLAMRFGKLVGLYASFAMMTMFTAYIVAVTRFSEFVPCSCGGILENMSWNQHLVFNVAFVVLAIVGIIAQHQYILLQQIRGNRKPV